MKKFRIIVMSLAVMVATISALASSASKDNMFATYYHQAVGDCIVKPIVGDDNCNAASNNQRCKVQVSPGVQADAWRQDDGTTCSVAAFRVP